jgi:hypothetical protein
VRRPTTPRHQSSRLFSSVSLLITAHLCCCELSTSGHQSRHHLHVASPIRPSKPQAPNGSARQPPWLVFIASCHHAYQVMYSQIGLCSCHQHPTCLKLQLLVADLTSSHPSRFVISKFKPPLSARYLRLVPLCHPFISSPFASEDSVVDWLVHTDLSPVCCPSTWHLIVPLHTILRRASTVSLYVQFIAATHQEKEHT